MVEAVSGEHLLELLNRAGVEIPQVCYHPQVGPIQTCDTCMVETNGIPGVDPEIDGSSRGNAVP